MKHVDLFTLKPINFTPYEIQVARDKLNTGETVPVKTLVKMLHQAQYQQIEYQSLVTSVLYKRDALTLMFDQHKNIAYPRKREKK